MVSTESRRYIADLDQQQTFVFKEVDYIKWILNILNIRRKKKVEGKRKKKAMAFKEKRAMRVGFGSNACRHLIMNS